VRKTREAVPKIGASVRSESAPLGTLGFSKTTQKHSGMNTEKAEMEYLSSKSRNRGTFSYRKRMRKKKSKTVIPGLDGGLQGSQGGKIGRGLPGSILREVDRRKSEAQTRLHLGKVLSGKGKQSMLSTSNVQTGRGQRLEGKKGKLIRYSVCPERGA